MPLDQSSQRIRFTLIELLIGVAIIAVFGRSAPSRFE